MLTILSIVFILKLNNAKGLERNCRFLKTLNFTISFVLINFFLTIREVFEKGEVKYEKFEYQLCCSEASENGI